MWGKQGHVYDVVMFINSAHTRRRPGGLVYGADTIQRAPGPCVWSWHYTEGPVPCVWSWHYTEGPGPCVWSWHYTEGPGAFWMERTLYRGPKQRVSLVASIHTTGEGFAIWADMQKEKSKPNIPLTLWMMSAEWMYWEQTGEGVF